MFQDLIGESYSKGLWHGSRMEEIANHASQISKFHFPELKNKKIRYSS